MSYPVSLKYDKNHHWCNLNGDGTVTVGLTTEALRSLTDVSMSGSITFVKLPAAGAQSTAGQDAGTIEGSSGIGEIFFPLAGKVTEVNSALSGAFDTVRTDPYGDGWLFKLRPNSTADLNKLMNAAAYSSYTGNPG